MTYSRWLKTFLDEKRIDMEETLEVEGRSGNKNIMSIGVVVDAINRAPTHEQAAIKTMMVKIDFKNGNVRHYIAHLAQAIAI